MKPQTNRTEPTIFPYFEKQANPLQFAFGYWKLNHPREAKAKGAARSFRGKTFKEEDAEPWPRDKIVGVILRYLENA